MQEFLLVPYSIFFGAFTFEFKIQSLSFPVNAAKKKSEFNQLLIDDFSKSTFFAQNDIVSNRAIRLITIKQFKKIENVKEYTVTLPIKCSIAIQFCCKAPYKGTSASPIKRTTKSVMDKQDKYSMVLIVSLNTVP